MGIWILVISDVSILVNQLCHMYHTNMLTLEKLHEEYMESTFFVNYLCKHFLQLFCKSETAKIIESKPSMWEQKRKRQNMNYNGQEKYSICTEPNSLFLLLKWLCVHSSQLGVLPSIYLKPKQKMWNYPLLFLSFLYSL